MKFKNIICFLCVAVLALTSLLTGCRSAILEDNSFFIKDNTPQQDITDEVKNKADSGLINMEKVAEDNTQVLFMNMDTAEFCVQDKRNGERYYSNPPDWKKDVKATDEYKNIMGSQVVVSYYGPDNASGTMNSYTDAFLLGQLKLSKIKDGVKVVYQVGTASSKRNFPQVIRKTEFDKILSKIPKGNQSIVKSAYRLIDYKTASQDTIKETTLLYPQFKKYGTIYTLRPNLGIRIQDNLESFIQKTGYSFSDIEAEYQSLGFVDKTKMKASFVIPVEYKLENGDFTATIVSKEFKYVKGFSLTKIDLLPFYGAVGKDKKGSIIVPDGSGALIEINRDTSTGFLYSQPIYGDDNALIQKANAMYSKQVNMPIFGAITDAGGILAVVENGEGAGAISANVGGVYSSYNIFYSSFSPVATDYLKYDLTTGQGSTLVFPLKISTQEYKVRYILISKKNPTYVDAAIEYRRYLEKNKIISKATNFKNVPLTVEFMGAIDKRETFFGVPYTKKTALTTFEEAQKTLSDLISNGINQLNVRYTGWANGGLYNTAFSQINPVEVLGGKSGLTSFNEYLIKNNIGFYPDIELSYVNKDSAFDSFSPDKDATRYVNRQVAQISSLYLSTGTMNLENPKSKYVLSPSKIDGYLKSSLNYFDKQNIKNISFASLGNNLSADYNQKKIINRDLSLNMLKESFENNLFSKHKVMLDGCNAALLKYANIIVNMPMESSRFSIEDASIPFYQIAVHGYISYAGEPMNMADDYTINLLKSVETGASLYCKWMAKDNSVLIGTNSYDLYSLSADTWFSDAVKLYKSYNENMSKIINAKITDHKMLSDNVFETSFNNGYSVVVNYNDYAIKTPFGEVGPKNYILTKEGIIS